MKAILVSSVVLMFATWLMGQCCYAQEFESRVRQHQEEVRRRIEESRARMQRHRADMERRGSNFGGAPLPSDYASRSRQTYVREYTTPATSPASPPATGRAVQPGASQTSAQRSAPRQPRRGKSVQATTARSSSPRATKAAAAPPSATPGKARQAPATRPASGLVPVVKAKPGKNLDQMAEIPLPPDGGSVNWRGFWKGALISGIVGGLVGVLAWVVAQLVRAVSGKKGSDPNDKGARIAVPGVAAAAIAVTAYTGPQFDQVDLSKVPLLGTFFPEEPKVSTVRQFQPLYSRVFQFSVSIPEPFGLEHKEIAKVWTTVVTHKEKDGAYSVAFATLPQPAQQTQSAFPVTAFSQVPAAHPAGGGIDVEKALDSLAQNSVDFMHGRITRKVAIRLNDVYPGREVEGTLPIQDGVFRERVYIANGNFYWQAVIGIRSWTNCADANKFLDSLKIEP